MDLTGISHDIVDAVAWAIAGRSIDDLVAVGAQCAVFGDGDQVTIALGHSDVVIWRDIGGRGHVGIDVYKRQLPGIATPFERLQALWQRFSTTPQTLDVIPVSNNPGSGDEVVLRDARLPIPSDVTSLEQARQLAPSRTDIPRMVPLDRLSSGQLSLFAFAGPLIFRDQPADIVLIDEPEQHLHVQWQRLLIPALRELSPTSQFFVATHSTEILDSALSYERFILVSDSDPRAGDDSPSGALEAAERE